MTPRLARIPRWFHILEIASVQGIAGVLGLLMLVLAGCGGHSDGLVEESNGYTYESVAEQIRAEDAANEAANKELDR